MADFIISGDIKVHETGAGANQRHILLTGLGSTGGAEVLTVTESGTPDRALSVGTRGNANLNFFTNDTNKWRILSTGHLHPLADGNYDVGAGGSKARDVYVGTSLRLGATPASTGALRLSYASIINARNVDDSMDLHILSFGDSDEMDLFDANMPEVRIAARLEFQNQINLRLTSTAAWDFAGTTGDALFSGDTTNRELVLRGKVTIGSTTSVLGSSSIEVDVASVEVATSSGASVTASSLIPAGVLLLGVTTRVLTTVTGPSGYDVGDGSDVDRWGNSISVVGGTQSDVTDYTDLTTQSYYAAAGDVVITSDGVDFTGGSIRVAVQFIRPTAPDN